MKYIFLLLVAFALLASRLNAQDYAISLQANGKKIATIDLSIGGDMAVAKMGETSERFNLKDKELAWLHEESKQWVTLQQCKQWAQQAKEKTMTSSESVPEEVRGFVEWSVEPAFKIAEKDSKIILTSGVVDYTVVGEKSDHDLRPYFRYARLNAYKKAMTERKLPPFAELLVIKELESRLKCYRKGWTYKSQPYQELRRLHASYGVKSGQALIPSSRSRLFLCTPEELLGE